MDRRVTGRGAGWALLAMTLVMALVVAGCDGLNSKPGPPPAVPFVEATKIAVILPAAGASELDVWEAAARREITRTRTMADIRRAAPGDPPGTQAEMIRQAVAEGISGLIVMADDPAAVAPALDEARALGLPVVLLDRAVPLSDPPAPRVVYTPEAETAKALVDAATADAKDAGFPPEGPALILSPEAPDRHARARVDALRRDLEARGVRVLPDVTYAGLIDQARDALKAVFPSAPHLAMVFAVDDFALRGASSFRHNSDRTQRRFVLAGYTHERRTLELITFNVGAAIVDLNIIEPIHRAFDTTLALLRGETVPEQVVSPTPVQRANGKEKEGLVPDFLSMPEKMENMGKTTAPALRAPDDKEGP